MRNATQLKPLDRPRRSLAEVTRWRKRRDAWLSSLAPESMFHRLFDHVPGVYFFSKDKNGALMFASEGLRLRYEMKDETEILGRTDFDLNPDSMAQAYVDDDKLILAGKKPLIERIELWWDRQGMPDWFLVTKLPMHDRRGKVAGVMGLLRRPDAAERSLPVFQTVAQAVEIIRRDHAKPLFMSEVAKACGQSLRQLQRRFQAAFGVSPQEFLLKARVLAAIRLLEQTTLTTAEIATRCGFVDASAFALHFRKRTGLAPREYRIRAEAQGT